ncbi:MAG TPA: hypothetical protein H9764_01220 [Candidatus Flavonifractor merdavium]|nr:hypothetical protein [Candidatus Flavonifractor merdavium]
MKRLRQKLKNGRGLTLVEMVAAAAVLALLGLMLHTGLFMAQNSYNKITGEAESQLLLSTLTDLLSNELRYARDVVTGEGGRLQRYTSVNYGRNTILALNENGQLEANERQMLSGGAYGNGAYRIEAWSILYDETTQVFTVELKVTGAYSISNETEFSVRCLNGAAGGEGAST